MLRKLIYANIKSTGKINYIFKLIFNIIKQKTKGNKWKEYFF